MTVIYNEKCRCGVDLTPIVKAVIDDVCIIYANDNNEQNEFSSIICPACDREYEMETGSMTVEVYLNPVEYD